MLEGIPLTYCDRYIDMVGAQFILFKNDYDIIATTARTTINNTVLLYHATANNATT